MTALRSESWDRLGRVTFDVLVIGAGIIGSRIAFEASRAGLTVALVDAGDFGGATSSSSSKLIHGGFRYLPMGDLALVWESQRERRALMGHVAPNLVRRIPMVLAAYRGGPTRPMTAAAGVLAYGALCGFRGTGVALAGVRAAQQLVPELRTGGLNICGRFDEGQTNDARLVLATVDAAAKSGATVLNHARVVGLDRPNGRLSRASIEGRDGEGVIEVGFRYVINAAGPWVDRVRMLEDPASEPMTRLSKGVHILLEPPSEWHAGLVVPVEDGRVTMALPWQGMLMLGTTDADFEGAPDGCVVTAADTAQVLSEASIALPREMLRPENVRYSFAGLRVLPLGDGTTANAHREHMVKVGRFGMVSIAGGKLTTHRRIAVEALRRLPEPRLSDLRPAAMALSQGGAVLDEPSERYVDPDVVEHVAGIYGREAKDVLLQRRRYPNAMERIHPRGPDVWAQVHHAVEREWAMTVDDIVRRRTTLAVRGLASDAVRAEAERVLGRAQLIATKVPAAVV